MEAAALLDELAFVCSSSKGRHPIFPCKWWLRKLGSYYWHIPRCSLCIQNFEEQHTHMWVDKNVQQYYFWGSWNCFVHIPVHIDFPLILASQPTSSSSTFFLSFSNTSHALTKHWSRDWAHYLPQPSFSFSNIPTIFISLSLHLDTFTIEAIPIRDTWSMDKQIIVSDC